MAWIIMAVMRNAMDVQLAFQEEDAQQQQDRERKLIEGLVPGAWVKTAFGVLGGATSTRTVTSSSSRPRRHRDLLGASDHPRRRRAPSPPTSPQLRRPRTRTRTSPCSASTPPSPPPHPSRPTRTTSGTDTQPALDTPRNTTCGHHTAPSSALTHHPAHRRRHRRRRPARGACDPRGGLTPELALTWRAVPS